MALATHAFDNCRHTEALILQILADWKKKGSTDYRLFQKHYNKRLGILYSLEKKVITESAQHAELKQEIAELREQLANTADTTTTVEGNVDQLYENQRVMVALLGEMVLDAENTKTSDVNAIAKQVVAILKTVDKKTKAGSNNNRNKVKLPIRQYNSYCHTDGVNLYCNGQGDECHKMCPCKKPQA